MFDELNCEITNTETLKAIHQLKIIRVLDQTYLSMNFVLMENMFYYHCYFHFTMVFLKQGLSQKRFLNGIFNADVANFRYISL